MNSYKINMSEDYLEHHGILGQKWGIRRYQNPDGTLTEAGRKRKYSLKEIKAYKTINKQAQSYRSLNKSPSVRGKNHDAALQDYKKEFDKNRDAYNNDVDKMIQNYNVKFNNASSKEQYDKLLSDRSEEWKSKLEKYEADQKELGKRYIRTFNEAAIKDLKLDSNININRALDYMDKKKWILSYQ